MKNNTLILVIAALVIGVSVLGYFLYEEKQQPNGIDIKIGDETLSIETN